MTVKTKSITCRKGRDPIQAKPPEIKLTPNTLQGRDIDGSFERDGYLVAREVFDRLSLDIYATYALTLRANNRFRQWEDAPGFHDRYADTLMESILLHLQPAMEQFTSLSLLPTYSFLRIYETGAVLARHRDRHSCEISASLTIGYEAPELWPLWLESHRQPRSIMLRPGDMLVYKGRKVPHWRERFEGGYWIQAFFHYVDADGPLASYKFDGRRGIGFPYK